MITGFEAYREYLSLRQHFNTTFDYQKYNGKLGVTLKSYKERSDKVFFERLAKKPDLHTFLLANFVANKKTYIKDLFREEPQKIFIEWQKRNQSLTYLFKQNLSKLDSSFDKNFSYTEGDHPILLKRYIANEICVETFCILLDITKALRYWKKYMKNDIVAKEYLILPEKYTPFIMYDKDKFKKIVIDYYSNNG